MDNNRNDYNKSGLIAFIFSVAFCLVFFVYVSFMHPAIDLKEVSKDQPAGGTVKVDLASLPTPWIEAPEIIEHGKKVYANNCAICHGAEGMGNGAAGAALNPPPRNFIEGKWTVGGTSKDLFMTLQNGIAGTSMAAFKHLPKIDRWALVQFIRSITKNKTPDDAAQTEAFGKTAD